MATIDVVSQEVTINNDTSIGKRKRPTGEIEVDSKSINGTAIVSPEQALESFQNLLLDLLQVLQEFDASSTILNIEIQTSSSKDRTPKRVKLAATAKTATILSLIKAKAYTNVDSFCEDVRTAIRLAQDQSQSASYTDSFARLEQEVISILSNELEHGSVPLPRSEHGDTILSTSQKDDGSLDTDPNIVLSTPGFVYGSSQTSKRLYSSFRLSSNGDRKKLHALPLEKLPNNITVTTTKIENIDEAQGKSPRLKDLFQHPKHVRLEPPRLPSSYAKGSTITWSKQDGQKKPSRSKDRQSYYDQDLTTGQWLSYNIQPSMSEMPSIEARRKRRDRALSTGEANVDLTEQEKESIRISQQAYQQAKSDSLFKSLYSSFAPSHDNSGAVVSKELKSRYWWIKHGAAKYLSSSMVEADSPLDDQAMATENNVETEEPMLKDSQIKEMLESWIDPELLGGLPKEKDHVMDKETQEILTEISDMLQMLSSYQRNRSLTLNNKQQGSSTQNKSLVELLGDTSTPSNSEWLLYDTLRDSLTSLIASLPPYAVAKLDGKQLGELNISTKVLFHKPNIQGTTTGSELQTSNHQSAAKTQPNIPSRIAPTQQVSTPTPGAGQNLTRPATSIYSKYRATPGPTGYQNYGSQHQVTPRASYGPQTPITTPIPLTNGTRPTMNGHNNSHGSQGSPQRPSSGSSTRPSTTTATQQIYSNYNANAVHTNAARSASPQSNSNHMAGQGQGPNWNPSNGTIGSMFSPEEVSRLEERQKAQMAAQAAQIRQDSGTPRPTSQAMSPISNGTPGG